MRHSEFWELMDGEFGAAYARTLARDLVLGDLHDRTADEALSAQVAPRTVWFALCEAMDVPVERRWARPDPAGRSRPLDGGSRSS